MTYYRYIYKVKRGSDFRFNEEGDLLTEVTIIATNRNKALEILENNYPHFRKNEIYLFDSYKEKGLFK